MNLPKQPEDVHARLADAYNTGDVNIVMAMYDLNGVLVPEPGKAISGQAQFEDAIKGILSIIGKMEIKTIYCLVAGDLALGRSEWSISENGTTKISAKGIEVMKKQADGNWKLVFDHAFGAEINHVPLENLVA
jgi:ketosteroid isomerase-like protein